MAAPTLADDGEMEIEGRLPYSSNFTFLVTLRDGTKAIYKPADGEQPLHDFPPNLYHREVAAYRLSMDLGWPNVPETISVASGTYGPGSLQRFIEADFEHHYFSLFENSQLHAEFQKVAVFDILANNADRKSGHCLVDVEGTVWCIDHGLCFNEVPKLRTVIWEFGGQELPAELRESVQRISSSPLDYLSELLTATEIEAIGQRAAALLENPVLPEPVSERQYPWPLL